ncbi:hypothetical protein Alches_09990 [Alicyclobacillus hesperidum subsp. aegles]|uniref:stage III sporulation protein AF n=1 Tax=Alicyclobacillus hesperidum TaxID=89784 RepID=UPI0007194571|nr:stage III sporulation protein AF [Alicyclobacillus hesperidum]KRW91979.1 hypothetical protein SD51_05630 [Alicyclobacillus tengchongensis]GLG00960.1 hypothetical protein Alches_09990 [Alicyclobacillus hesperidum subsp. aegles]
MTALGEWLKQIVAIAMLAGIAEMLLPTRALVKYVRSVLGVAMIASMLSPLVPMLRSNWPSQLATQASAALFGNTLATQATNVADGSAAARGYAATLNQEESLDADKYLAQEAKAALPENLTKYVTNVQVENAMNPAKLSVTVAIKANGTPWSGEIGQTIAEALGVESDQVLVVDDGGR